MMGLQPNHYVYIVKVLEEPESTCFRDAVGKQNLEVAMDVEMAALDENHTWGLVPLPQ